MTLEPPQVRTFHSHQIFTSLHKMPATSAKLITLLHTLISSQICRVVRALSRAKTFLVEVARKGQLPVRVRLIYGGRKGCGGGHSYMGSFRLHYNWSSSRSFSMPGSQSYLPYEYDVTMGNVAAANEEDRSGGLSGYLRWLEERKSDAEKMSSDEVSGVNEIDELADEFIAKFHEKFILEKQESDRRFEDMLARSI